MIKKKDCLLKHSKKEKCRRLWRPNVPSYIAFLLCIVLLLTSLDYIPSMAAETYDFTDGEYQYNIIDEGASKVEIVGQINLTGKVEIPKNPTYNGKEYEVTSIGESAFQKAVDITSITIPDSVISIGDYAFSRCNSLTSITIPDSVTSIGKGAFDYCTSLTSITIPGSVTSIGPSAFDYCTSLTSITIPDSVTSIGYYAFRDCSSLTSITIPNSVTSIEAGAFIGCNKLTSITIPGRVFSIENSTFAGCTSLRSIILPDSVTSIENEAFRRCISLTSITLPNSVTSIGHYAFQGCSSLTSITIPDSVTSIGKQTFEYCSSLTSITIPHGVISIGDRAFRNCSSLTSITLPDSVTSIGNEAFRDCSSLTSITLPDRVNSIGENAFFGCSSLTSIAIPGRVISIEDGTFATCSSLTSITIPDSVIIIGNNAFSQCMRLTSITIPDSVTSIGDWAFSKCDRLRSITLPDSVTSIGKGAFWLCSSLRSITISGRVFSIENSTFAGCSSLRSITLPDSVTSIGNEAFRDCSSLTSITLSDRVRRIENYAFLKCSKLKSFKITISEDHIGNPAIIDYCFWDCPDDRYLIFLTEDGTTKLDATTKPTLEDAVAAYRAVDDGDTSDDLWYSWKINADVTSVTIRVMKDGEPWSDHGKQFALKAEDDQDFITDLIDDVPDGTYKIYDITGAADSTEYVDTGVTVTVDGTDAEAEVNYYTVSFYDVAKEEVSADTRPFQEEIVLKDRSLSAPDKAEEPVKDGYVFDKWVKEDGSAAFGSDQKIKVTEKTDIYASWSPDAYSVTYYIDGEIYPFAEGYHTYTYGKGLTLPIPDQAGYTFDGWYTDDGYTSEKVNAISKTETGDKVYYGRLTENVEPTYPITVKVNKDGTEWENHGRNFSLKTDGGDWIREPFTARAGKYSVYDMTDSTEGINTGVIVEVKDAAAEATVNYYTVSFYDVTKEEVTADTRPFQEEIVLKDRSLSAPDKAEEPAKDGYTFDKWVKADGSAAFASGDTISITEKTDIYASWIPEAYSVTYYVDGETYPFAEEYHTYTYGTGLTLPIPDQAGYTFDGWYTDDGYTSEKVNAISKTETGDKVYYGRLTENVEPTYPITVNVNKDGTEWEDHGRKFSLKTDGGDWIREPFTVSTGQYHIYDMTDSAEGVNTGVTVEVRDAAEATVNYYTVSFYDVAKEEVSEDTRPYREEIVLKDGSLSAPDKAEEPAKDGYTFDKWVKADGSAAFGSDQKITVTEKTDIYASWIADAEEPFTIRASAGSGGSVSPNGEVKVISGGSQQFAMRPEDGYRIVSVLVDGMEMLGSGQIMDEPGARSVNAETGTKYYTFTNVTSDHTLEVYFEAVPGDDKPDDNEPDDNKPDDNKPDDNKPDDNKPDDNKPDDNKPDDNKPDDNKPDDNKPDDNKPDDNKPNDNKPDDNEPDDNKPDDNEPDDNEPDDNKPGDNEPDDNEPDDNKPDDNKPDDNKPDDNKPGDNQPDDNEPDDNEPDDNKPNDNKPDDNEPDDNKPDDNEPDDSQPDDNKPGDNQPDDTKPDDIKPDDNKPDDSNPDDNQPDGNKPDDSKLDGNKPDDSKPDNTKPDDNNAQPDVSANTDRQEPQTGDDSHIKIYATVAMIASFSYLLLYFTDEERGMTEQRKKEIVDRLIKWAKKGKLPRRLIAITAIFFLLAYYHGIGKYTAAKLQGLE